MSDTFKAFIVVLAILISMIIAFTIVFYKNNKNKEKVKDILIGISFVVIPTLIITIFGLMGFLIL